MLTLMRAISDVREALREVSEGNRENLTTAQLQELLSLQQMMTYSYEGKTMKDHLLNAASEKLKQAAQEQKENKRTKPFKDDDDSGACTF